MKFPFVVGRCLDRFNHYEDSYGEEQTRGLGLDMIIWDFCDVTTIAMPYPPYTTGWRNWYKSKGISDVVYA